MLKDINFFAEGKTASLKRLLSFVFAMANFSALDHRTSICIMCASK